MRIPRPMRKIIPGVFSALIVMLLAALAGNVLADKPANAVNDEAGEILVYAGFSFLHEEVPEGVTIDKRGNIYVTMGYPIWWNGFMDFIGLGSDAYAHGDGQVWKISPDGTETRLAFFEGGWGPAGIAVNARGDTYFARYDGVYRLNEDRIPGGENSERLPGTENIWLANGLALDRHHNLFVSDSIMGSIWRMPAGESHADDDSDSDDDSDTDYELDAAAVWSEDPLLDGCGDVGANGVALWKDSLYVANTSRGLLVRIPILDDGTAGIATLVAGDNTNGCSDTLLSGQADALYGLDGIALDVYGNVFALSVIRNELVRIDPSDGSFEVLLTAADGLDNPASIVFGTRKGDRRSIFISNYAIFGPIFGAPDSLGPAVLKFDVGVRGLRLP